MTKTISVSIICLFLAVPVTSNAGNLMIGLKGWYTWWDSAIGDFAAQSADLSIEEILIDGGFSGVDLQSNPSQGDGFLGGPLLSYQTDDGLWSLSLAWMGFGSFSQDADLSATVEGDDYEATYNLELDRSEIDFAVTRKVTERLKVFLGYKHQSMEYNYEFTDTGGKLDVFKAESTMYLPTIGIGYVHPLSDKMFLGLQGGLLFVNGFIGYEDKIWDEEGYEYFDATIGFNGEISISYMINKNIILQAGYRYQTMKLKADFSGGSQLDDTDTVQGFVVSAVYLFDL